MLEKLWPEWDIEKTETRRGRPRYNLIEIMSKVQTG
jgi:hypothetical protein